MPQISVIVPVYKVEPYLHRCVDSILGQTFTDFELILVDDGSPDNCGIICDEYALRDSRIHVIHQENGGLSAARNAGIDWAFENSNSQWITFIDSDDWIHPEMLERLLNAAMDYDVAVSICGYAHTTGQEPEIQTEELEPKVWSPEDYFVEHRINAILACCKLYRKEDFREVRYPVGKINEDEFTTYQILFCLNEVVVIPAAMYYYFQSDTSIIRSAWTPKRLDDIEAKREGMAFFLKNGFNRAYQTMVLALLRMIASYVKQLERTKTYRRYRIKLRMLLRKEMRRYRKAVNLTIKEHGDLYEVAYPIFMKYYWLLPVALKKLHLRK